ncbi:SAM-dependent methyltransferase [Mycolicibacterium brisbanense]|uniref:Methyltransferase, cyclopropane fatty acid synthase n=1 Tax=Mycolicibacterium brisbanense TaxID=146020 RepID=A0A100W4M2_9MYCO|nr:cyclopropane-fatty-acyl-phospholipid synthase family protein [Mycolicibacterium brisbanense]MCV7157416.1 class I SAM-dependent methyltransferase [Mycolicibacterium brisbanense]GAS91531.1 methyltransferase, cyclopropane fatty acid synthase [Mycolicibacterium brisbanense]
MSTTVADTLAPLICDTVRQDIPFKIQCWDGSRAGPSSAPWQLTLSKRGLLRLLWEPNELGLARAYVAGDIDVEGDLLACLEALERVSDPMVGPRIAVDTRTKAAFVKAALRLGIVGLPPRRPPEEARRLRAHRHGKRRDAAAISHHYDVGNDFYRLVLGESMTYSCAYWTPSTRDLDDAQYAKCDLIARKLGLCPGMRVLDVGCGWGTFALHVAQTYDARVVGITLSRQQAEYATKRVVDAGLGRSVQIRVQDYRDVDDGPYDAIASIGMAEHVGAAMLPTYAAQLFQLLRPQGRLLNSAISRRPGRGFGFGKRSFIDRYLFPDGELEPMATMVDAIEQSGFEVRDVESLREHYERTLRAWVANLEDPWDQAVAFSSAGRARVWRLYMAGSAMGFASNRLGLNQVLAVKNDRRGRSHMPATRAELLSA